MTKERVDLGPVFEAQFGGTCAGCGSEFYPDEEVRYSDGEVIGQACCGQDLEDANRDTVAQWSAKVQS
jgi:uncharacterized protein (DUF779 family)